MPQPVKFFLTACLYTAATFLCAGAVNRPETESQRLVESAATDPGLGHGVLAVLAVTDCGDTIACLNNSLMMVPASNMKLLTSGTALKELGPSFRFRTEICCSGNISRGVLDGDLYICGGGDPTLASPDTIAASAPELFEAWMSIIRDAGIKRIKGRVIGDGRCLDGTMKDGTWEWSDLGTWYGTGCCGLNFYENRRDFTVKPGKEEGEGLTVAEEYPVSPWMNYTYECYTGAAGSGFHLASFSGGLAPQVVIRGTSAAGGRKRTLRCGNDFPEYSAAWHFMDYLVAGGIACRKGAADTRTAFKAENLEPRDSLRVLGETLSPRLDRIITAMNHASNNLYAEAVFRMTGKYLNGDSSPESSREALYEALRDVGMEDLSGIRCQDGCGLSTKNLISPDFLCSFLLRMKSFHFFPAFLESLPRPGENGTLQDRMPEYGRELKRRVYAKSGTMTGVRCLSGYILPSSEEGKTVIFSILVNNSTAPVHQTGKVTDALVAAFARDAEHPANH